MATMTHTESPTAVRHHLPRLIADRLGWNERRADLGLGFYEQLDRDLVKFGTERKQLLPTNAIPGIHAGDKQEYALLESPRMTYRRDAVFPVPIVKEGKMWATHDVDRYE